MECPICGVPKSELPLIDLCENHHSFCIKCIKQWRKKSFQEKRDFKCPTCRSLQEKYKALEGKIVVYYLNSIQKKKEATYYSGIRHGKYQKWYPDGKIKEDRYFIDGYEDGDSYFYDENGKYKIITFNLGEKVDETENLTLWELTTAIFRL
jgi:hypothetical protein